jgi:hypothetical protein
MVMFFSFSFFLFPFLFSLFYFLVDGGLVLGLVGVFSLLHTYSTSLSILHTF